MQSLQHIHVYKQDQITIQRPAFNMLEQQMPVLGVPSPPMPQTGEHS